MPSLVQERPRRWPTCCLEKARLVRSRWRRGRFALRVGHCPKSSTEPFPAEPKATIYSERMLSQIKRRVVWNYD